MSSGKSLYQINRKSIFNKPHHVDIKSLILSSQYILYQMLFFHKTCKNAFFFTPKGELIRHSSSPWFINMRIVLWIFQKMNWTSPILQTSPAVELALFQGTTLPTSRVTRGWQWGNAPLLSCSAFFWSWAYLGYSWGTGASYFVQMAKVFCHVFAFLFDHKIAEKPK